MQPEPHSRKEHVRPFQMPVCIFHTQDSLPAPVYIVVFLKWQCPVSSPIIIGSWIPLRLSNSSAFIAENCIREPLTCFCSWMDCQYSSCFLFIQFLLTFVTTFADMTRTGSGSESGCEEPCLANSFHSHMSWHPYQLNPFTFCKLYQGMMALPDCLEFIWKLLIALMTAWLSKII